MPVQRTLFGRPITLVMPPRRFQLLFAAVSLFVFFLLLLGTPQSVDVKSIKQDFKEALSNPKLPSLPHPFGPAVHKPLVQANSTSGSISWFTDWKWRNPFSSDITSDERAVLPPLRERPRVYTFYDDSGKTDDAIKEAENRLLLIWRRAWWAQGFEPVVLSRQEAILHPLYEKMRYLELDPKLEAELARWLAWGQMGTGILANYLALPMAPRDDPLLIFLRHGKYPKLTRFSNLNSGLFCGDKNAINDAIQKALANGNLKKQYSLVQAVESGTFTVDEKGESIAFYDHSTIEKKYPPIQEKLADKKVTEAYELLAQLINAHLHTTWLNTFEKGVVIVKPAGEQTTALSSDAIDIARNLTQCPINPVPKSCPPNRPSCTPCDSRKTLKISFYPALRNTTEGIYQISTVPHPYTFLSLTHQRDAIDTSFIRRKIKDRDPWLRALMKDTPTVHSSETRATAFKDAVAGEYREPRNLFLTAEGESHKDLNWIFGFDIPGDESPKAFSSKLPLPQPEPRPPYPGTDGTAPAKEQLEHEKELLRKARGSVKSSVKEMIRMRNVVEAWNLADTEVWNFARAFSARRRMERENWEKEESDFAGAERRKGTWARWTDW